MSTINSGTSAHHSAQRALWKTRPSNMTWRGSKSSAMAAWDAKLSTPTVAAQATQKLQELTEVRDALADLGERDNRPGMRPHQIQKLFDAIDLDGDGEVTYAELVDFLVEQTEE